MLAPSPFLLSFEDAMNYILFTKEYSDSKESETQGKMEETLETMTFVPDPWNQVRPKRARSKRLASSQKTDFLSCISLAKLLNFYEPQFPHLCSGVVMKNK